MGISFRLKREYREELPDFLKEDISISLEELANESGRCDLEEPIEERECTSLSPEQFLEIFHRELSGINGDEENLPF